MSAAMEVGTAGLDSRAPVRVTVKRGKIDLRVVSKLNAMTGIHVPTGRGLAIEPAVVPELIRLLRRASKEVTA